MPFPTKKKVIEKVSKISRAFIKEHPGSKKNPQGPDFYSTKFGRKGKQGDIGVKQVGDKWRSNMNVPMLKPFLPKFFDKRDEALHWLDKLYTMSMDKEIGNNFQHEEIKELGLEWSFKVPKSLRKTKVLDLVKITETLELDKKGGFPMAAKKKSDKKKNKKEKKVKKNKKKGKKNKRQKGKKDVKAIKKIKEQIKAQKTLIKEEKVASKVIVKEHRSNIKVLKKQLKAAKKGK